LTAYCPNVGDIIWLDFLQAIANEQAGRRPALVLSPRAFNELTGRCVACPITRRDRDWSFHVAMTGIDDVQGVVQTDQLRSLSWEKRGSRFICSAPVTVLAEVRAKLKAVAVAERTPGSPPFSSMTLTPAVTSLSRACAPSSDAAEDQKDLELERLSVQNLIHSASPR
jgi:mRNA interferase MazF